MNSQQKNETNQMKRDMEFDSNFSKNDLEILKQVQELALEFKKQYSASKKEKIDSNFQKKNSVK